jgi:hypothetical protein
MLPLTRLFTHGLEMTLPAKTGITSGSMRVSPSLLRERSQPRFTVQNSRRSMPSSETFLPPLQCSIMVLTALTHPSIQILRISSQMTLSQPSHMKKDFNSSTILRAFSEKTTSNRSSEATSLSSPKSQLFIPISKTTSKPTPEKTCQRT